MTWLFYIQALLCAVFFLHTLCGYTVLCDAFDHSKNFHGDAQLVFAIFCSSLQSKKHDYVSFLVFIGTFQKVLSFMQKGSNHNMRRWISGNICNLLTPMALANTHTNTASLSKLSCVTGLPVKKQQAPTRLYIKNKQVTKLFDIKELIFHSTACSGTCSPPPPWGAFNWGAGEWGPAPL